MSRVFLVLLLAPLLICQLQFAREAEAQGKTNNQTHISSKADEALKLFYKENLEKDFSTFGSHKLKSFFDLLYGFSDSGRRPPVFLSLIIIKDNKVRDVSLSKQRLGLTVNRVKGFVAGIRSITKGDFKFPDTAFVLNVGDHGRCGASIPRCTAPVFSFVKDWDFAEGSGKYSDILVPNLNPDYGVLRNHTWSEKNPKALMRAILQNQMQLNCTRLEVLRLAKTDPDGKRLLDAGITNNLKTGFEVDTVPFVPTERQPKWKFVISTSSSSVNMQFGKQLGFNSVVLKEQSPAIEFYYRSLVPSVHFLPFNVTTLIPVLLDAEKHDKDMQEVVANAQAFVSKYLSMPARALYLRHAIQKYNALFGGEMEKFVGQLPLVQVDTADAFLKGLRDYSGY